MNITRLASLTLVLLVIGCATEASRQRKADREATERRLKLYNRVKVLMYDTNLRAKSDHIDIITQGRNVSRPFKEFALLTCEGALHEETEMTQAIIDRAKAMGGDAIVILNSHGYVEGNTIIWNKSGGFAGGGNSRAVFRGLAILYEPLQQR